MMRNMLTISKWELKRTQLSFDMRTRIISVIILILIGAASFLVSQSGIHLNNNIYNVVLIDPSLGQVIKTDDRFKVYVATEDEAKYQFKQGVLTF